MYEPQKKGVNMKNIIIAFTGFFLSGVVFATGPQQRCTIDNYRETLYRRAVSCILNGEDLSGQNLRGLKLARVSFRGADLRGVELQGSSFIRLKYQPHKPEYKIISTVDFTDANLTGAIVTPQQVEYLESKGHTGLIIDYNYNHKRYGVSYDDENDYLKGISIYDSDSLLEDIFIDENILIDDERANLDLYDNVIL